MKVNLMRWVDYYLGVPLCFLLSIVVSLERLFGLRKMNKLKKLKPKKILFIELSEMGSTILAYGAMKKAKELFNAELYFMIFRENEQSIKMLDIIPKENVVTIRSSSLFFFAADTISAVIKLRLKRIDCVIDLELFSRFTSLLSFFITSKAIAGFYRYSMEGLYRGNFQTHRVAYNPHLHISQNFIALVYALNADISSINDINGLPLLKREIKKEDIERARIIPSHQDKLRIVRKLQEINPEIKIKPGSRIVLLNPNASQLLPVRKWPLQNFILLAERILKIDDVFIAITGTKEEGKDAEAICSYVKNKRCLDMTGKTTLKELVELCSISDVIVTNDSGPAHFASLSDIKIVVLFGPETPIIYSPLSSNCESLYSNYACSPCVSAFNHRKTICRDSKCLKAIKVEDVFGIVEKSLTQKD